MSYEHAFLRGIEDRINFFDRLGLVSVTFREIARRERLDTIIVDTLKAIGEYDNMLNREIHEGKSCGSKSDQIVWAQRVRGRGESMS